MQEPEGYVMNFVGGDVKQHSDSNRWTDNKMEKGGSELEFVTPVTGKSTTKMSIFDPSDDRVIQINPVDMTGQYNFITAQALMPRVTQFNNFAYSQKCLQAAIRCFEWCTRSDKDKEPNIIGAAMQASIELYRTTNHDDYKNFAIERAARLKTLQAKIQEGNPGGFFYTSFSDHEPYKNIWQGCLAFLSLCDLTQTFPLHNDALLWKSMIADYVNHYLLLISKRNSFGIIPFGLYAEQDPGG